MACVEDVEDEYHNALLQSLPGFCGGWALPWDAEMTKGYGGVVCTSVLKFFKLFESSFAGLARDRWLRLLMCKLYDTALLAACEFLGKAPTSASPEDSYRALRYMLHERFCPTDIVSAVRLRLFTLRQPPGTTLDQHAAAFRETYEYLPASDALLAEPGMVTLRYFFLRGLRPALARLVPGVLAMLQPPPAQAPEIDAGDGSDAGWSAFLAFHDTRTADYGPSLPAVIKGLREHVRFQAMGAPDGAEGDDAPIDGDDDDGQTDTIAAAGGRPHTAPAVGRGGAGAGDAELGRIRAEMQRLSAQLYAVSGSGGERCGAGVPSHGPAKQPVVDPAVLQAAADAKRKARNAAWQARSVAAARGRGAATRGRGAATRGGRGAATRGGAVAGAGVAHGGSSGDVRRTPEPLDVGNDTHAGTAEPPPMTSPPASWYHGPASVDQERLMIDADECYYCKAGKHKFWNCDRVREIPDEGFGGAGRGAVGGMHGFINKRRRIDRLPEISDWLSRGAAPTLPAATAAPAVAVPGVVSAVPGGDAAARATAATHAVAGLASPGSGAVPPMQHMGGPAAWPPGQHHQAGMAAGRGRGATMRGAAARGNKAAKAAKRGGHGAGASQPGKLANDGLCFWCRAGQHTYWLCPRIREIPDDAIINGRRCYNIHAFVNTRRSGVRPLIHDWVHPSRTPPPGHDGHAAHDEVCTPGPQQPEYQPVVSGSPASHTEECL